MNFLTLSLSALGLFVASVTPSIAQVQWYTKPVIGVIGASFGSCTTPENRFSRRYD